MGKASDVNINFVPGVSAVTSITSSPLRPSLLLRSAAGALQSSAAPGPGPGLAAATVNTGIREILVTERQVAETIAQTNWSSGPWGRNCKLYDKIFAGRVTQAIECNLEREILFDSREWPHCGQAPRVRSYLLAGQSGAELTKRYNKVSWRPSHPCCQT